MKPDDLCTLTFEQSSASGDSHTISINFQTQADAQQIRDRLETLGSNLFDFQIKEYVQAPIYTAKEYLQWLDRQ